MVMDICYERRHEEDTNAHAEARVPPRGAPYLLIARAKRGRYVRA